MMNISHDEFVLIYNVLKEYYDVKEKIFFFFNLLYSHLENTN